VSQLLIQHYLNELQTLRRVSGTSREGVVSEAFNGVTLHGLRSTRVIELRRAGLTTTQIQDQVGMSLAMIERYCRFADRKASGKALVVTLSERRKTRGDSS